MPSGSQSPNSPRPAWLRIIGGELRGQRIRYSGNARVRPMKDRVREALFNLLGDRVRDRNAIDLFAGTGALGLEAISRGARRATLIERHGPTARLVRENVERLRLGDRVAVLTTDAFRWAAHPDVWPPGPWLVFCCPPYRLYDERGAEMDRLIGGLAQRAEVGSLVVVEAPDGYDIRRLPRADRWQVRSYHPALLAILEC